jgi:hypothetical protein
MSDALLVKVFMLAFEDDNAEPRYVEIPLNEVCAASKESGFGTEEFKEDLCHLTFHWGQNDFQPQAHPSVSVGDVIVLSKFNPKSKASDYYLVCGVGFQKMNEEEFEVYRRIPRRDRMFSSLLGNS